MAAIGLMMATSMSAQHQNYSETPFTQGKAYVGASFSGTDLSYSGITDGRWERILTTSCRASRWVTRSSSTAR